MFFEEARDRRRRAQLLEEFSVVEEFGYGLVGAVALVDFRFFFVVEEVHRCCRRALSCAAWLPSLAVYAVCVAKRAAIIRVDAMNSQRLVRAMTPQLLT